MTTKKATTKENPSNTREPRKPAKRRKPTRSESVSRSWDDPQVRAARSARHAVRAKGTVYPSFQKALDATGFGKLVNFINKRKALVASGQLTLRTEDGKLITFKLAEK